MNLKWCALLAVLFSTPALSYPAPYTCTRNFYVDAAVGNDTGGCGTSSGSSACRSLPYVDTNSGGSTALTAGDCVHAAAGTYNMAETYFGAGGSSNQANGYVTWVGASNHTSILHSTGGTCTYGLVRLNNNYQIWDGFNVTAPDCKSGSGFSQTGWGFLGAPGGGKHHQIVINNDISGANGGIGVGGQDYYLIAGNTIHDTTSSWLAGISTNVQAISGFTATLPNDTQTYHEQILDNKCFNNGFGGTAHTDGECIIVDNGGNPLPQYSVGRILIAGNVAYANGGACIAVNNQSNVDATNNSCYGNQLDTGYSSTVRGEIYCQNCANSHFTNNILFSTPPSSGANQNDTAIAWDGSMSGVTWNNNITNGIANGSNASFCSKSIRITGTGNDGGNCSTVLSNNPLHDTNPLFVSTADLHLQAGSAGLSTTGSALPVGVLPGPFLVDLDGNLSPSPPHLGAYNLVAPTIWCP